MLTFIYKARNSEGSLVTGELDGETASDVKHALAEQGLLPTNVSEKGLSLDPLKFFRRSRRISVKDLVSITRQLAALFKAGVPIDKILSILSRQMTNKDFAKALEKIRFDIGNGMSMKDAFSRHPQFFDELYINMLGIGEQGGVLDRTLFELTKVLQKEYRIKANVKSATLYPKIVLFVFFSVTVLMLTYVIPRFAVFYGGFDTELPLPTRILVGISDTVVAYWYIAISICVGIFIVAKKFSATEAGSLWVDKMKFRLPVFGNLHKLIANARFGHLVGTLYNSGLALSQTLTIVGNAIGNKVYKKDIEGIKEDIEKGASISKAMETKRYFTPLMVESVAVGEQAGTLGEMLNSTAEFYDDEVDDILEKLTTLIEPLLIVFIFGMVALLALAIFLPMWNVTRLVLQGGA